VVRVSTFTMRGVFIGMNGTSTDMEKSICCQVVAGQPSHVASRPSGAGSTDSGFSSSCRRVAPKFQVEAP
jgi:hypothetical protein